MLVTGLEARFGGDHKPRILQVLRRRKEYSKSARRCRRFGMLMVFSTSLGLYPRHPSRSLPKAAFLSILRARDFENRSLFWPCGRNRLP